MIYENHKISFTRRRYSRRTVYTWIHVYINNQWIAAGDPVPKIIPSKKDLSEAINYAHARYQAEQKSYPLPPKK